MNEYKQYSVSARVFPCMHASSRDFVSVQHLRFEIRLSFGRTIRNLMRSFVAWLFAIYFDIFSVSSTAIHLNKYENERETRKDKFSTVFHDTVRVRIEMQM